MQLENQLDIHDIRGNALRFLIKEYITNLGGYQVQEINAGRSEAMIYNNAFRNFVSDNSGLKVPNYSTYTYQPAELV